MSDEMLPEMPNVEQLREEMMLLRLAFENAKIDLREAQRLIAYLDRLQGDYASKYAAETALRLEVQAELYRTKDHVTKLKSWVREAARQMRKEDSERFTWLLEMVDLVCDNK